MKVVARKLDPGFIRRGMARHVCAICLFALIVFLVLASPPGSSAATPAGGAGASASTGAGVAGSEIDSIAAGDTWTRQDLLNAEPAEAPVQPEATFDLPGIGDATSSEATGDFSPGDVTQFPNRIQGKIFFRIGADEFSCSGTVVNSDRGNVVFTAGHCVYDISTAQYVDQLVFVPAYENGNDPLGIWPATAVFTPRTYVEEDGSQSHDIGVAVLESDIQSALGSRKIAFDLDPADRQFTIFGYPAEPNPPFNGEALAGCRSQLVLRDPNQGFPAPIGAAPCSMQQGSSGGGWITGGGYLNSVVSYGYCDSEPELCGIVFGPYFGDQAKDLYTFSEVGGSVTPTLKLLSAPARKITKRRAKFKFAGEGSTPISFRCRIDRRSFRNCGATKKFKRLKPGKHVVRVKSIDQTGRLSKKRIVRKFRVLRSRR